MVINSDAAFTFPAIDGLHLSDKLIYPLLPEANGASSLGSVPLTPPPAPPVFATLYPEFEAPSGDDATVLLGGGGAWEGEGFLALVHRESRQAQWVLYCQESEPFISASGAGDEFNATSGDYPYTTSWSIRGSAPYSVVARRERVA